MDRYRIRGLLVLVVVVAVLAVVVGGPQIGVGPISTAPQDRVTLTVFDEGGEELGQIDAMVADDWGEKYTGLSDTDRLAPSEGMVFVYGGVTERAFVMRDMAFPLDIIFVDGDGTITGIEQAAADDDRRFTGEARWVIEVNRGYAEAHGIAAGDSVEGLPR